MIHPETSDSIVTLTIILTFVIVSTVYGAKYQYTGAGRSWISFSAGEFLCKKHFWQSQRPKGGFILTEADLPTLGQTASIDTQEFLIYDTEQKDCRSTSEMWRQIPGAWKAGLQIIF